MGDTGGKSGRRPGSHLQVEASGPGNAASVQQRLAGRFRRGEVVEGCAGGAEGRSKRLICLRRAWMEDTGGKSGRRPGRHPQATASDHERTSLVQQRHFAEKNSRDEPEQWICGNGAQRAPPRPSPGPPAPDQCPRSAASGPSPPLAAFGRSGVPGRAKSTRRRAPRDLDGRCRR